MSDSGLSESYQAREASRKASVNRTGWINDAVHGLGMAGGVVVGAVVGKEAVLKGFEWSGFPGASIILNEVMTGATKVDIAMRWIGANVPPEVTNDVLLAAGAMAVVSALITWGVIELGMHAALGSLRSAVDKPRKLNPLEQVKSKRGKLR